MRGIFGLQLRQDTIQTVQRCDASQLPREFHFPGYLGYFPDCPLGYLRNGGLYPKSVGKTGNVSAFDVTE